MSDSADDACDFAGFLRFLHVLEEDIGGNTNWFLVGFFEKGFDRINFFHALVPQETESLR